MLKQLISGFVFIMLLSCGTVFSQNWKVPAGQVDPDPDSDIFRRGRTNIGKGGLLNGWPAQLQVVNDHPSSNSTNQRVDFLISRAVSAAEGENPPTLEPFIKVDEWYTPISPGASYTFKATRMMLDEQGKLGLGYDVQSVPSYLSVYPLFDESSYTMEIAQFGAYTYSGSSSNVAANPRSIRVLAKLGNSAFNHLSQDGDFGLIYNDGKASGQNQDAGFVIAPWSTTEGGLRLDHKGRVNIGKAYDIPTAENYKLTVRGKILAEEIQVKTFGDWPDYVFTKDHNRLSFEELETYIEENGHLPNVPSAEEVDENGVGLGEMNRILLEKVEELTLYMLELKKENERLESLIIEK